MGFYQRVVQPRLIDAVMGTSAAAEVRERVCAALVGDVVEIGYGSGHNQPHLPPAVTGVWAVDPSATGFVLSAARRAASAVPVVHAGTDAADLPFPDDRFDAALSTWTLCATPDPVAVLRELARVLRPGATLHLVEHGVAEDPSVVRWQRRASGLNKRIAGCVLDQDVQSALAASGLDVVALGTYYEKGAAKTSGFTYEGRAVASGSPRAVTGGSC